MTVQAESSTSQRKPKFDSGSGDPILSDDEAIRISDDHNLGARKRLKPPYYPFACLFTVLLLEAIVVFVLEGFRIDQTVSLLSQCVLSPTAVGVSYTNLIYRGLVIAAPLYQLLLCVETLGQRCTAQLYALILFGFLYIIFAGIQAYQNQLLQQWMMDLGCWTAQPKSAPEYEYALLSVIPACFLMFTACTIRLHSYFQWSDQPSSAFTKTEAALSTLLSLVKLDLYFCFTLAVQLTPATLIHYDTTTLEAVLVGAIGSVLFVVLWYAIQNERLYVMAMVTAMVALALGYFGFRLATFAQVRLPDQDPYQLTRYSLIYTSIVLVILVTLTTGVSALCTRRMLQGIKVMNQ